MKFTVMHESNEWGLRTKRHSQVKCAMKILWLVTQVAVVNAFSVYDCNQGVLNYRTVDLTAPGECPQVKSFYQAPELNQPLSIVQTVNDTYIDVISCTMSETIKIHFCGFDSISYNYKYHSTHRAIPMSRKQCLDIYESGQYTFLHKTRKLQGAARAATITGFAHGTILSDGTCVTESFTYGDKQYKGIAEVTRYVSIDIADAMLELPTGNLYLNGGKTKIKYAPGQHLLDNGDLLVWYTHHTERCSDKTVLVYEGSGNVHRHDNQTHAGLGSIITIKNDSLVAGFILGDSTILCNVAMWTTQVENLYVLLWSQQSFNKTGRMTYEHSTQKMDTVEKWVKYTHKNGAQPVSVLDFFNGYTPRVLPHNEDFHKAKQFILALRRAESAAALGYVEISGQLTMAKEFKKAYELICKVERRSLYNKLALVAATGSPFAFRDEPSMNQGVIVIRRGAVAYIAKCPKKEATLRLDGDICANEIPVSVGGNATWVDPFTFIISPRPTTYPCDPVLPSYFKIGSIWYCINPAHTLCDKTPEPIRPQVVPMEVFYDPIEPVPRQYNDEELLLHRKDLEIMTTLRASLHGLAEAAAMQFYTVGGHSLAGLPMSKVDRENLYEMVFEDQDPIYHWGGSWLWYLVFGCFAYLVIGFLLYFFCTCGSICAMKRGCSKMLLFVCCQPLLHFLMMPKYLARKFDEALQAHRAREEANNLEQRLEQPRQLSPHEYIEIGEKEMEGSEDQAAKSAGETSKLLQQHDPDAVVMEQPMAADEPSANVTVRVTKLGNGTYHFSRGAVVNHVTPLYPEVPVAPATSTASLEDDCPQCIKTDKPPPAKQQSAVTTAWPRVGATVK